MALYNVTTVNNTLLAVNHFAHATSEGILQNAEDTDFESIREIRAHWKLANIVQAGSTADTAVTNVPVETGDRIFIRHNSVIHDTFAVGVAHSEALIHPVMTSNTSPSGVASSTDDNNSADAWKVFDGNVDTYTYLKAAVGNYFQYNFQDNTPTIVYNYYVKYAEYIKGWVIEGSLDGVNWSTISSEYNSDRRWCATGRRFSIDSPGAFSYYRLRVTSTLISTYSTQFHAFHLLTPEGTTIDTSLITQGGVPSQVFRFEDLVRFNGGNPAVEKDIFYEYGETGEKLYVLALYNDVLLTGRILQTKVEFSAADNELTELTGQIFKLV